MAIYEIKDSRSYKLGDDGERTLLCNFDARITAETRYNDGENHTESYFTLSGSLNTGSQIIPLPPTTIPAASFFGLGWAINSWGAVAIIQPGPNIRDDIRACIQGNSTPTVSTIYRSLGWTPINGKQTYLHAKGALGSKGNDPSILVQLPHELKKFDLTPQKNPKEAALKTLALQFIGPPTITWPLWAATFAPLFGPVDFCIHLCGKTGTFKSELMSIYQSHFGPEMTARNLPASWSSTPNALEAQAYYARNAVLTIDDFVPTGSSYQVRNYHNSADKIVRAQGNQAGRARLTDTSRLQQTMYPRGIIFSTGEDIPEGLSVRARMLILDLSPGDITPNFLSQAQAGRPWYSSATAALITHLATHPANLEARASELRDKFITKGHARTPAMLGQLLAVVEYCVPFFANLADLPEIKKKEFLTNATNALLQTADDQTQFLSQSDPCDLICSTLRHILGAGLGHIRTMNGGVPRNPSLLGWTEESSSGDMPTYRSHGPCLGWIHWDTDELFIDTITGFAIIKKVAGPELPATKQTLFKRLKDSGLLTRVDDTRQRNTVRITAEAHPRQVVALSASATLETAEKP